MGVGDQLAGWGKVLVVETRGRRSGRPARAAVGFVEEPDGSYLVAASDAEANWAQNLFVEPRCTVSIEDRTFAAVAEPIEGAVFNRAIRDLILKYGTTSERLGSGPAFRLRPAPRPGNGEPAEAPT